MFRYTAASAFMAFLSFGSVNGTYDECKSIAEIACTTEGFETLCTAVKTANLAEALSGDHPFTVFAPTNDAFAKLPDSVVSLLQDVKVLENVLMYHVVLEELLSTDLECGGLVTMANTRDTRTICEDHDLFQKGSGNTEENLPKIIGTDILACNGVIHVVDNVILPAHEAPPAPDCKSIAEIACNTEGFSTLCSLVGAADLGEALTTGTFTVFAPTDEAFANLPEEVVDAVTDDIDLLTNVLLYHTVADEIILSEDLVCGNLVEMANGKFTRTVCKDHDVFQRGAGNTKADMPKIIGADVMACNGVIHVIDEVILPK